MDRNTAVHTNSETPIFTKKIGKTTYIVGIHFDEKQKNAWIISSSVCLLRRLPRINH